MAEEQIESSCLPAAGKACFSIIISTINLAVEYITTGDAKTKKEIAVSSTKGNLTSFFYCESLKNTPKKLQPLGSFLSVSKKLTECDIGPNRKTIKNGF